MGHPILGWQRVSHTLLPPPLRCLSRSVTTVGWITTCVTIVASTFSVRNWCTLFRIFFLQILDRFDIIQVLSFSIYYSLFIGVLCCWRSGLFYLSSYNNLVVGVEYSDTFSLFGSNLVDRKINTFVWEICNIWQPQWDN